MARLNVRKTYKLYINGEFPRTESGRFYGITAKGGELPGPGEAEEIKRICHHTPPCWQDLDNARSGQGGNEYRSEGSKHLECGLQQQCE